MGAHLKTRGATQPKSAYDWNTRMKTLKALNLILTNHGYTVSRLAKKTGLTLGQSVELVKRLSYNPLPWYEEDYGKLYFDWEAL
jgi:DNA-binding MarR family transcriptional regulator